jgi:hypothetical protein
MREGKWEGRKKRKEGRREGGFTYGHETCQQSKVEEREADDGESERCSDDEASRNWLVQYNQLESGGPGRV